MPRRNRAPVSLALAGAAATALAAAWYLDARRREHKAARIHRTMVQMLLNALSAGDPVTERHSRRVAALTDALASVLGLERHERARLRVAALLHDMGKIDDQFFHIIHGSEPLSPEERRKINRHPHESAHILEPLNRLYPGISRIVESHHECWGGGGYPRGLRGEEIPLEARIISVADVYDALTQPRLYKQPFSVEEALEEIRCNAGKRFDPGVVAWLERPAVQQEWRRIAAAGRREERRASDDVEAEGGIGG